MRIEKTFQVATSRAQVWEFITTPEKVALCIPGCEGAEQTAESNYKAVICTKIGPVKAKFYVNIEAIDERPPEFAEYLTKGEEGSKASRIKATSTLALKEIDASLTEVSYTSDISIMGRLGKFGSGMMTKVADSIGDEFVAELRKQLEQGTSVETTVEQSKMATNGFSWKSAVAVISALILICLLYMLA